MSAGVATPEERLEQVRAYLQNYPCSVVAVSYAGDAPPLVPLGALITPEALQDEHIGDPVFLRFVQRLKRARPDLRLAELLALPVPLGAGDQEVYTARLGKWQFERRIAKSCCHRQWERKRHGDDGSSDDQGGYGPSGQ